MSRPLGLALLAALGAAAKQQQQPNIMMIIIDDLGFSDVGFRSSGQIRTPAIDAMAADGIVLEQYYVQDVCSPSRATFMTGRYPLHHTVNDWLKSEEATALPLNETTLASTLRASGYRTHAVGKWHLGEREKERERERERKRACLPRPARTCSSAPPTHSHTIPAAPSPRPARARAPQFRILQVRAHAHLPRLRVLLRLLRRRRGLLPARRPEGPVRLPRGERRALRRGLQPGAPGAHAAALVLVLSFLVPLLTHG